jgi:hypothetical protein
MKKRHHHSRSRKRIIAAVQECDDLWRKWYAYLVNDSDFDRKCYGGF